MARNAFEILDSLLYRLLEGRVVPFVGAGISMEARVPDELDFVPKLSTWTRRLKRVIWAGRYSGNGEERRRCRQLWGLSQHTSFDRLCELAALRYGSKDICDRIDVSKTAKLAPLPAHRYLAYLAREGLVREIISTNYDCCIERAFDESFGESFKGINRPAGDPLAAVADLTEYRRHGGRRRALRRPVLRLYKINGCAQRLLSSSDPDEILLTERQLQGFDRKRYWVRDLISDRVRRYSLLICGFGSDEPQVRHTALAIMEEFKSAAGAKGPPHELPNAPFVAAHQKLSYSQLQILAAFARAHLKEPTWLQVLEAVEDQSLSGENARTLEGNLDALKADLFFERLYQGAFRRLIERYGTSGWPLHAWLNAHVTNAVHWIEFLRSSLYHDPEPLDLSFGTPAWREATHRGPDWCGPLPFQRWLWATRQRGKATTPPEPDSYLPVREDPLLVLVTLLVVAALLDGVPGDAGRFLQAVPNVGLEVRYDDMRPGIHLAAPQHDTWEREAQCPLPSRGHTRLLRVIAIPSLATRDPFARWRRLQPPVNGDAGLIWVGRQVWAGAGQAMAQAGAPRRLKSALEDIFSAVKPSGSNAALIRIPLA